MSTDMLAQHGSKSGWLHRKKKAHLLGGTAWKKGYWVLNGKTKTLREFASQADAGSERGAVSSYEPRNIAKAGKDGNDLMVISFTNSSTKLVLRCESEEEREDWLYAFDEILSDHVKTPSSFESGMGSPVMSSASMGSPGGRMVDQPLEREASSSSSVSRQPMDPSMSPMMKHASARSLLRVASNSSMKKMGVQMSPLNTHKSLKATGSESPSITASPLTSPHKSFRELESPNGAAVPSPLGTPKKSFFEKDMIDSQLFMNKARSLANSINRDTAESIRLKTGGVSGGRSTVSHTGANARLPVLPHMVVDTSSIDASRFKKSAAQYEMLLKAIRRDVSHFGNTVLVESPESLVDLMFSLQVNKSQRLIVQGESVDRMFVLEQGKVGVYSQDFATRPMELETMKEQPGEAFGVLSIIYNQPGLFTIQTQSDCKLWVLPKQRFDEVVTREAKRKVAKKIHLLERIPLIAENLDKSIIDQLADSMDFEEYKHGAVVVKRGDALRRVIIIVDGLCGVALGGSKKEEDDSSTLKKGDFFGEWVLLEASTAKTNKSEADLIVRSPQCTLLTLFVDEVEDLIGPLRTFILKRFRDSKKDLLSLSSSPTPPLPAVATTEGMDGDDKKQAEEDDTFVTLNPILAAQQQEEEEVIRQVTIALKKRETHVLHKKQTIAVTSKNDKDAPTTEQKEPVAIVETIPEREEAEEQPVDEEEEVVDDDGEENLDKPFDAVAPLRPDLTLQSLTLGAKLGQGSFGIVHLAKHGKEQFALKVVHGEFVVSNGWEYAMEKERDAMLEIAMVDSPFLLKMFNVLSDTRNIYFVTELCEGGSLSELVQATTSSKRISEDVARFYLGCVVHGLELLHQREICYRDLKPDNIMIDSDGYGKLIDFGLAKKTLRTFTVCGTPDYTAPEVLARTGHGMAVDWWAMGVLLYELLCGTTPFCGFETMDIYENILAHEKPEDIVYPNDAVVSPKAKDLIAQLLHPKRNKRLGIKFPGVEGLKKHPFFTEGSGCDWDAIKTRKAQVPIKPQRTVSEQEGYNAELTDGPVDKSGWTAKFASAMATAKQ